MRHVFLMLLLLNVAAFGYYSYLYKPSIAPSVAQTQATLTNPVTATNVSDELPPLIGTKK
ncbi:hypothetical protein [Moraxella macacae]|uniref:hypothetical protein n=1 Tax=Moraxella macacae TaxID=765840 RepID=UPI0002EB3FB7|nr:hypothetical protein [Moraxella macacae]